MRRQIWVEAPARLHFGVLDLRGDLGRRFGGVGAAVSEPHVLIEASLADELEVSGADADRASQFARKVLDAYAIEGAVRIVVHQALPAHSGLGSGTQLALSVARAVTDLFDLVAPVEELAHVTSRGLRSAIGTWLFSHGGFVLEGGRYPNDSRIAPLLARCSFPAEWRYVLAIPAAASSFNSTAEAAALAALPAPIASEVEHVAHLVLMGLLPSITRGDLETFGRALTRIQQVTGGWFASAQGGRFAAGQTADLIQLMLGWGAVGVGQSSWGPAVYGVVSGDDAALKLADRARAQLGEEGVVFSGPFRNAPARVWRQFQGGSATVT